MINYKALKLTIIVIVIGGLLAGCTSKDREYAATDVKIEWEQAGIPIASWKMDNSHMVKVSGKVLVDEKPVVGAELSILNKRNMITGEDGTFDILVDRSIPQAIQLKVTNVERATIEGKLLGSAAQEAVVAASSKIEVYYPIQVVEVKADPKDSSKVEVHARAITEEGQSYPIAKVDKYFIQGVVKDSSGEPVQGAIVSFTRDAGEGWSRSEPTNKNGEYLLYYFPEDDEDLLFAVHVGQVKYTLPEGRVNRFPEGASVMTSFTLPTTGTIIQDEPPTLISGPAEGAIYWSRAIGVSVDESVVYTVSLPEADGSFVLNMDKVEWEKSPHFYQTELSKLSITPIKPGDVIPSEWLSVSKDTDPTNIVAEIL